MAEAKTRSGKQPPIGIDLGTTFSAIAFLDTDGQSKIISNAEGQRTTPSVVSMSKDGQRLVGLLARRQAVMNPDNTVRSIKRDMGLDIKNKVGDKQYTPPEISAMILQKLKLDAEAYLGVKITQAVITVPAYFSDAQRQATKDAGKIAGLEVLRIINEPTSASLAYALDKEEEMTVLVFDLGGGTFDVSILDLADGVFEVKATSGNNRLGGDDFDDRIVDWLADKFKQENGFDLRNDNMAMQRLRDAAETAKIELSQKASAEINLPYITADQSGPKHLTATFKRSQFEIMIADLIEKTMGPTRQALADAKMGPEDIDRILLVGGSTRVPAVQSAIKNLLKKEPSRDINPDECVAVGAAIQAGVLMGEVEDVLLLDVTPLSLGIETLGGVFTTLIPRNTTIPTRKSQIFSTASDSQPSVEIHVLQGERQMAAGNKTLGKFHLVGIPPAPRGVPQIDVTFDMDANGIAHVSAKDLGTGNQQEITITSSSGLSEEDIEKMVHESEEFAEEDERQRKAAEARNTADSLIYQTEKVIKDLGESADPAVVTKANEAKENVKKALEEDKTEDIESATEKLTEVLHELTSAMYAQQAQQQAKTEAQQQAGGTTSGADDPDVVDVDYEIVDDE